MSDLKITREKPNSFSIEKACKSHNLLKNLQAVIESHQDESAKNFGMAILHLLNSDFTEMTKCLKALAQAHPEVGLINRRIAEIYINQNDFETAIAYLEKALELDKEDVTAKIWLGLGYFEIGNEEKAKTYLKSLSKNIFMLYAANSNLFNQETEKSKG